MIRKRPFGRSDEVTPGIAFATRPEYARLRHEPLEVRKMLAAYINEIYIDPPGSGGDTTWEYIELRTDETNYSLEDHYLIQVENEETFDDNHPGEIELIFDLGTLSFGTNGFLVLQQRNTTSSVYPVHPDANVYANTFQHNPNPFVSNGYGSGAQSTLPAVDINNDGRTENSAGTFMLIHNVSGSAPFLTQDLDTDDNGLDVPTGAAGWVIVDAVGVHGEADDPAAGILYATVNFGVGSTPPANIPAGADYVDVGLAWPDIEYVGRWGDSTGQTADDWHAANLTNDNDSPYTGNGDFRQSGGPDHGFGNQLIVESSRGVAYGTNLTGTLGSTNFQNATVTGRRLFYNNSIWDNEGYGYTNASAIATDKVAYIPTGSITSTFANMSSYSKGINGILVEIANVSGTLTEDDFTVRMSGQFNAMNNSPGTWVAAPSFTVTHVPNTPVTGTDRYELIWPDGAITNRYVYVLVEGGDEAGGYNIDTGLPTSDYFFFGNMIGDTGQDAYPYPYVNATDQLQTRNNQGDTDIVSVFDFNRDAEVNATDQVIVRNNQGGFMPFMVITGPGPFAPERPGDGDDGSGSAVASALAAPSSPVGATPTWVSARLAGSEAAGGPRAAASPHRFTAVQDPRGQALLAGDIDEVVDVGLDDELLDALTQPRELSEPPESFTRNSPGAHSRHMHVRYD
jgi:hypothetical protein